MTENESYVIALYLLIEVIVPIYLFAVLIIMLFLYSRNEKKEYDNEYAYD